MGIFDGMGITALALASMAAFGPCVASAEQPEGYDTLQDKAGTLPARSYDYAILGIKPGMNGEEAAKRLSEHLGKPMQPTSGVLQVKAPNDAGFRSQMVIGYVTPGIGPTVRMSARPYEEITLDLSTPALGSVVTGIHRTWRIVGDEAPAQGAFFAQIAETYGAPHMTGGKGAGVNEYLYMLSPEGAPVTGPITVTDANGNSSTAAYPCQDKAHPAEGTYRYRGGKGPETGAHCSVRFSVRYQGGAQDATLRFDLVDFDLMRRDEQAADPQIEQKLSAPATATKLDL